MGRQLWDQVQTFRTSQQFPPSTRAIARKAGIPESTLANWQHITSLPAPDHLRAVSSATGLPYQGLLNAALADAGY